MRHPAFGLSAASLGLVVSAVLWSVFAGPSRPAYAQLVEPLMNAESGRFVTTVLVGGKKVMRTTSFFSGPKTVVKGKHSEPDSVMVQDGATGLVIEVSHQKKQAVRYRLKPPGGEEEVARLAKYGGGLLGAIRYQLDPANDELPEGSDGVTAEREELEERLPGGRVRRGVRITGRDKQGALRMQTTVWAHPRTGEPTEMRIRLGSQPGVETVLSELDFDYEPDPAMFSTEPPEGYTLVDKTDP